MNDKSFVGLSSDKSLKESVSWKVCKIHKRKIINEIIMWGFKLLQSIHQCIPPLPLGHTWGYGEHLTYPIVKNPMVE